MSDVFGRTITGVAYSSLSDWILYLIILVYSFCLELFVYC